MSYQMLKLSEADVDEVLTPSLAYRAVREALECHARGDFQQPLKPYVRPQGRGREDQGGRFIAMPAFLGGQSQVAGLKWIAGFPANPDRGLPRASGLLVLSSTETGRPLAVLDCARISARRTAAVAELAFEHLAPAEPRLVAVVGAGPIARAVVEALGGDPRRGISGFRVCDLHLDRAAALADSLAAPGRPPVAPGDDPEACVRGADVVVTATAGQGSRGYLKRGWVGPGSLVVALSLDDAAPELLLAADKIVVDDFDQCCREEKLIHRLVRDGRLSRDRVHAELGQILVGSRPGRESPGETIYVNPMGMAIEDLAVGLAVYREALSRGIGQLLEM